VTVAIAAVVPLNGLPREDALALPFSHLIICCFPSPVPFVMVLCTIAWLATFNSSNKSLF
jgi:hypothetical protein